MFVRKKEIDLLFNDYNEKLSEVYNEILFSGYTLQTTHNDRETDLIMSVSVLVEKSMIKWARSYSCKQFGGLSFYEYFESLDSEIIAFDYLQHSAYICDDGVPMILTSLLYKNRDKIAYKILDYILEEDWQNNLGDDDVAGDNIMAISSLINLLEQWGCDNVHKELVSKYVSTQSPFDIISDAIKAYLSSLKSNEYLHEYLISNIESMLEHSYILSAKGEVLLISLVAISAGLGDKSTYLCLEKCFLRTSNKIISAICFGDLQDKRAVEFLRNWLFENQKNHIDEVLRNEIISSISRLGGKTSDIENSITE